MRLSPPRAALAALTVTAALGTSAASAQAATPFSLLSGAKSGSKITLSPTVSILPGSVKKSSNGTVTLPNSTVQVGSLSGTGVTATATSSGVVLSGGTFAAPTSVTDNTLKSSTADPVTVAYSDTDVTAISGSLTSTKTAATDSQLDTVIGPDLNVPVEAVPSALSSAKWSFKLGVTLQGLSVHATAGLATLDGTISWFGSYTFGVTLTNFPLNGGTVTVGGSISGSNIFKPAAISGLSGTVTSPIKLGPSTTLLSGSVAWGSKGLSVSGAVRFACTTGTLDTTSTGTIKDDQNFSFSVQGVSGDCTLGKVASFDKDTFQASIGEVDGALKYSASFGAGTIELFDRWLSKDADLHTYLSNVSGKITNSCAKCTGNHLQLSFAATGVGETRDWKRTAAAAADPVKSKLGLPALDPADRTSKTSFKLQATVTGVFDMNGATMTKTSIKLSNVKFNLFNFVQTFAMQQTLQNDTIKGFSAKG